MSVFSNFVRRASELGAATAPLLGAGAALSTGGQAATLSRLAGAAGALGGVQPAVARQPQMSETGQSVAVSITETAPRETAVSGEAGIQPAMYRGPVPTGGMGGIVRAGGPLAVIPPAISAGRGVMGMLGLAGGAITVAPFIIDPFTGEEKKLRVTRKLKSDVKKAVEMFGVEFVAEQMGTNVEVVFYILTKKMRNDGPYVTKAAVRKTRQTVRKMKNLCDMYDDLRPAARRRAPARKTMSTRITNVK
jgi:hypothetical protein